VTISDPLNPGHFHNKSLFTTSLSPATDTTNP
jgi:hypothetical protein